MTSNAKFCAQCGHELPDLNPPFCSQCGSTVSAESNSSTITNEAPITLDTPISAILSGFKNYINFSGKATRYELFWFVVVCAWLIPTALNILTEYMAFGARPETSGFYWALYLMFFQFVTLVYFVGITIPLFAVFVRRLHSVEKDTKWVLTLAPYWALLLFSGIVNWLPNAHLMFPSICMYALLIYCLLNRSVQDSIKLKLLAFGIGFLACMIISYILLVLISVLFMNNPLMGPDDYPEFVLPILSITVESVAVFGFIPSWYIYKRKFE
jgi:uncharacterized membrane protein YhaH (DUF805 family)